MFAHNVFKTVRIVLQEILATNALKKKGILTIIVFVSQATLKIIFSGVQVVLKNVYSAQIVLTAFNVIQI